MRKTICLGIIGVVAMLLGFSCSVNFKAVVEGTVVDQELYEMDSTKGAIGNVRVYIYLNDSYREKDYQRWQQTGLRPDEPSLEDENKKNKNKITQLYSGQVVTTDQNGIFSMQSIWWTDYVSKYGTDASIKNAYFLFYHDDYGLVPSRNRVVLIGDGNTVKLPPFPIQKAINETLVKGRIIDANQLESAQVVGIPNVTVKIYMPKKWSIENDTVVVANDDWKYEPTYTISTDANGYFSQMISYRKFSPGSSTEMSKIKIRLSYELANYSAFCLTTEANEKFCGYEAATGNVYSGDRILDLKDVSNWVLFDGETKTVSYWDHNDGKTIDSTVGRNSSDYTKCDFDLNADGYNDVYYEMDVVCDGAKRENIMTISDLRLRKNQLTAKITGRVYDASNQGVDDATVTFYWFNDESTKIASVNSASVVYGSTGMNIDREEGHYNIDLTLTSYNHIGNNSTTIPIWLVAKKGDFTSTMESKLISFGIVASESQNIDFTIQ